MIRDQERTLQKGVASWLFVPISYLNQGGSLVNSVKKTAADELKEGRKFPAAAYEYNDDVTEHAVQKVREKAAPIINDGDWEVIDGFGRTAR